MKMDVTAITDMPLEDWLLPNETIRFSALDGHSKLKVNVTDKRLIFYKEGLASESLEAYMLDHIAGYRITITRKITYLITGITLTVIGIMAIIYLLTFRHTVFAALKPLPELITVLILATPFFIAVTGITLIPYGITQYGNLELAITGKGKITKTLKLSRHEYIQLSKHLSMSQLLHEK